MIQAISADDGGRRRFARVAIQTGAGIENDVRPGTHADRFRKEANDWNGVYRGLRVAVVGASGFIGRWVARYLYAAGASLHLGIHQRGAAAEELARYGVQGRLFEMDLLDRSSVDAFMQAVRPVVTFNLAGYGVDPAERDEEMAYRVNTAMPRMLCESIAAHAPASWTGPRFIHTGSALEYGTAGGVLDEDSAAQPTNLYGRSKLAGTVSLQQFSLERGFRTVTARLFTVYGSGEHAGRLLPSLLDSARQSTDLRLTDGLQERDFTYVEDVTDGLLRLGAATLPPSHTVVNLATGRLTPVRQFVETAAGILKIPQFRLKFGALPTRPQEMIHSGVTVARLRNLTGWTPSVDPAQGICRTLEWNSYLDTPEI